MDTSRETTTPRRRPVVVGIDGSPGARAALDWALEAAVDMGARVEGLAAYPVDFYWTDPYLVDPRRMAVIEADTRSRARELVEHARSAMAGRGGSAPEVDLIVVPGPAPQHLVQRSAGADLLVVGSRGRSGVASTVLGSVALHCSAHARCPVVVVHPTTATGEPRVVVGLDDSEMSRAALARGADEAIRLGARLDVVVAFQPYDSWSPLYEVSLPPWGETREHAARWARRIVSEVLGESADRLIIRVEAQQGVPGEVLVRAATGALMLVVGSLSRSRIEGMVLGSVAMHCAVHAPCPVMIVHPRRDAREVPAASEVGTTPSVAAVGAVG